MTGICIVGEWMERACLAGAIGATAASLKQSPREAGLELGLRLATSDGWRIGVPLAAIAPAVAVDRSEEDPERWDGLS